MTTIDRVSSRLQAVAQTLTRVWFQRPDADELTPLPSRPTSREDVPAAARSELERSCGDLALERMLVIVGTGKRTWIGGRLAMHTRVIAFGSRAVGQWTEGEGVGSVESVLIDDLVAIDDRTVLLHGCLSLIGRKGRIAIPYNTVARPQFRESVLWLRRRMAGPEFATRPSFVWIGAQGSERSERELPYKWTYLLACRDDLRIDPPANEMVAVGDVVEQTRFRTGPATGLALLGPRELLIAAEPSDHARLPRHGVDLTVVPRCHLLDVGWSRGNLRIRLRAGEGAPEGTADELVISRPLDGRLFEAMRRSFGDALEWA